MRAWGAQLGDGPQRRSELEWRHVKVLGCVGQTGYQHGRAELKYGWDLFNATGP